MKEEETEGRIYKYLKISKNTKENLINNVLYFSDPEKFNDPCDCKHHIIHEGTKEDWRNYLRNESRSDIDQLIREKKVKSKKKNIFELNRTKLDKETREDVFKKRQFRASCFCETNSNILMWTKYAEKNQGICLCFKTRKEGDNHSFVLDSMPPFLLYPVKYIEQKPKIVNMVTLKFENKKELMEFFTKKDIKWEKENEHRILIMKNEFKQGFTKKFIKEDLEGVIFGLKTKPETIQELYKIINTHYLQQGIKVNFYDTHEGQDKYEIIKIESIEEYYPFLKP